MDELDEIRKRKMEEIQAQARAQDSQEEQMQGQIQELESVVKNFLSREALERYGNLKSVHTEKAIKVLATLGQLIQSGQIKNKLTDGQFKEILQQMEPPKKEFKINK